MNVKRISIIFLLLFVASCSSFKLSRFDNVTYINLTSLRPEVIALYKYHPKVFSKERTELHIRQYLEYERGKPGNEQTIRQIEIILETFQSHMKNKKWSDFVRKEFSKNMDELITIAIETEKSKNEVTSY